MDGNAPDRIEIIDIRYITEDASNYRKHFDETKLGELAADIAAHGVLVPLLVRPLDPEPDTIPTEDTFEVVCGARRYRASKIAGRGTLPCIVRAMTDQEALEAQLSENGGRLDARPLETADAYLRLHEAYHVDVDTIASRFGARRALVLERLAVARACPELRAAVAADKIRWGLAVKVARLPIAYQPEATKGLVKETFGEGMTVAEGGMWLRDRYHLRLASAPFPTTDATLCEGAPACDVCPKNTSSQRELFGEDVAENDSQCTDPLCYAKKRQAAWERRTEEHRAAGRKVLTADQSAAIVQPFGCHGGYARADIAPTEHGGRRTWKALLGVHYPTPVIARAPNGDVVEVLEPDELADACKKAGLSTKKSKPSKGDDDVKSLTKEREEERIEEAARAALVVAVRQAAGLAELSHVGALDFAARVVAAIGGDAAVCDTLSDLVGRTVQGAQYENALNEWLRDAQPHEVITFVAVVAARTAPEVDTTAEIYRALRATFGVNCVGVMEATREVAKKKSEQKLTKLPKKSEKPAKETKPAKVETRSITVAVNASLTTVMGAVEGDDHEGAKADAAQYMDTPEPVECFTIQWPVGEELPNGHGDANLRAIRRVVQMASPKKPTKKGGSK